MIPFQALKTPQGRRRQAPSTSNLAAVLFSSHCLSQSRIMPKFLCPSMAYDHSESEEQPRGLSQQDPHGCVTVPVPSGPIPTARWDSRLQEPLPRTISLLIQQCKHSVSSSFLLVFISPYIVLLLIMIIKHTKDQYLPKISENLL